MESVEIKRRKLLLFLFLGFLIKLLVEFFEVRRYFLVFFHVLVVHFRAPQYLLSRARSLASTIQFHGVLG